MYLSGASGKFGYLSVPLESSGKARSAGNVAHLVKGRNAARGLEGRALKGTTGVRQYRVGASEPRLVLAHASRPQVTEFTACSTNHARFWTATRR